MPPAPTSTVEVPPELARAMSRSRAAKEAWQKLAPSHKKEYARWITDAKKDDTRTRRLEQAIAMLAEGRSTPMRANDAPAVSAAPLAKKLGVKAGQRAVVLAAPEGYEECIPGATTAGRGDVVLAFAKDSKVLGALAKKAVAALGESSSLWVAYPKKTSGIPTDLTRDVGWDAMTKQGWEVCSLVAVDASWSAVRFRRSV